MNFFAHYYFYNIPNNHWYNAGLLFPDLLRNFTKNNHLNEKKIGLLDDKNKIQSNLTDGIRAHFKADLIFHNWEWFKIKNLELAQTIRKSNLNIKRDWFLAHIFIELAIDHVLVKENEEKVALLYNDLNACQNKDWEIFFTQNNFLDCENWMLGFNRFIKHHYIVTYKNTENVIYALSRIYHTTGIGLLEDNQMRFLEELLNTFVPEVKSAMSELRKILE